MKLYLFFMMMDLLTVLAYPIVFLHGKFKKFSRSRKSIAQPHLLVAVSIPSVG
jgi:hypothetical protein